MYWLLGIHNGWCYIEIWPHSDIITVFTGLGISIIKIGLSWDKHIYIEKPPAFLPTLWTKNVVLRHFLRGFTKMTTEVNELLSKECILITVLLSPNQSIQIWLKLPQITVSVCFDTTQYMFISPQDKFKAKRVTLSRTANDVCGLMVIFKKKYMKLFM